MSSNIILLGDIALSGIISTQPERVPERYLDILEKLNSTGIVLANLEVPACLCENKNENKPVVLHSDPEVTRNLLKALNITCVSLANNHIYDCKMPGLISTIEILDDLGIHHTGAGWRQEHTDPIIIRNGDIRLGIIAYVDKATNPKTDGFEELRINYFEMENVLKDIKKLKLSVDKIVCSIHWGNDYSFYPSVDQISMAEKIIDAGVDIIMGHHPHTLQPFKMYKTGIIFFSLGSLTFGDFEKNGKKFALYRKTKKSVIVESNLEKMTFDFTMTKELKGNVVRLCKLNFTDWTNRRWGLFKLKYSSNIAEFLFDFNEKVLTRIYEYFFGYYMNPFLRLIQLGNLKKLGRLFRDIK